VTSISAVFKFLCTHTHTHTDR